jgi:CHAT domain-containing protein
MFRYCLLTVILIIFANLTWAQQSKGDTYFKEGNEWLDKGDNEKAINSFLAARKEHLKTQNYYRYFIATDALSIMYQELGDGLAAEKIISETMANIPTKVPEQMKLHAKLTSNLGYTYLVVLNEPEKAVDAYSNSITLYERAGLANTKSVALQLVNRALAYQQLARYQLSANDVLKAISIYENEKDIASEDLANNYYSLGVSYTQLQKFDQAIVSLQKGLALIQTTAKSETQASFYSALGDCYEAQNSHQLAIKNYEQAITIIEPLFGKDADHYCQTITLIGDAYKNMGDWEGALLVYQEILTIYQKAPPTKLETVIPLMLSISNTMRGLGMAAKAHEVDDQALLFVTTAFGKNSVQEAEIYKHLGAVAYNHGEDDKSLAYNFKALTILNAANYSKDGYYAEILETLGMAYVALGDSDLALKYKWQAKELYQAVYGENHSTVATMLGNLGLTYEATNQYEMALTYLNQSIALLSKDSESNRNDLGIAFIDVGRIYLKMNDPNKAIENLEKARLIFDSYSKNLSKAKVYNNLGGAYFMLTDFNRAMLNFQKAVVANVFNFEDINIDTSPPKPIYLNYYQLITSYLSKADVYRAKGDKASLLKGLAQLDAADQLIKQTGVDFSNTSDRLELAQLNAFFTEAGLQLVDKLFTITKEQTYLDKAFYFSERSKANELLTDIQLSKATSLARVPKAMLARRNDLLVRLNTLRQQIASATSEQNQALIGKLKTQEFDLTKEYELVQTQINEAAPKLALLSKKKVMPTWNDISKSLGAKTVLVSYSITDSAKYILIGHQSKLVLKRIDPKIDIDKLVRAYLNQLKFKEESYKQVSAKLTDILWTPVEEAIQTWGVLNAEKVIIVPEGPLNYLPFESLGNSTFLIEKYAIHYSFSAALLLDANKQPAKEKPSFIAMAPVFEDKETNFVNKSCERFVEYSKKADTTSRAFSLNGEYITPLPGTRSEVEAINLLHKSMGSVTKSFIEEAAHEARIKNGELESFDYIHLATHGFVNSQYQELSGLLLTQDAASAEDGILYSGEIVGLKLNAQLVTLSACETALGKKVEGEGTRGLATAFLFAGAKNVVASLWKVSDASTSELMIEFYTELLRGKDKATALKLAKLKLIKSEEYDHPYYWAPFVQIGGN